ncbi:MAG TPA: ferredoxin family protein [Beijerinckiaceae bacterium]|nr:ferredoxin family protein [Beijerinckiaceae bacterium]
MADVSIDNSACTGCGRCIEICPVDVLRPHAALPIAIIAYADDCCGCRLCAQECPTQCITVDDTRDTESMSMYDKLGLVDQWDA